MARYIDAEWLLRFFEPYHDGYHTPLGVLRACVDDAPSIDIVRCGECKLSGTENCPMDEIDDEYFCNFGEREGE